MKSTELQAVEQIGVRPFPWRCPRCRPIAVRRMTIPYSCLRMQNGQSIRVEIEDLAVPKCAQCGELVFDYAAERQINSALLLLSDQRRAAVAE